MLELQRIAEVCANLIYLKCPQILIFDKNGLLLKYAELLQAMLRINLKVKVQDSNDFWDAEKSCLSVVAGDQKHSVIFQK
jgi:hypothetical protein